MAPAPRRGSLLRWMEGVVRLRRERPEIGFGDARVLDVGGPEALLHTCEWEGHGLLAAHNLSGRATSVELDAPRGGAELLADRAYPRFADGRLELGPYGYRWLEYDAAG